MRALRIVAVAGVLLGLANAQPLSEILGRLDRFASTFKGVRASVRYTMHTAPLSSDSDEVETGLLTIQRLAPGKIQMMIAFTGENAHTLLVSGQTAEIYHPKNNEIQVYDIRKYRGIADKLSLLGFGMAGRELSAHYDIEDLRRETVGAEAAAHLQLVPKAPELRKNLPKVELWFAERSDCAVKQKLYSPGGSYRLAEYSGVQVNPALPPTTFDLPKSAKRVRVN